MTFSLLFLFPTKKMAMFWEVQFEIVIDGEFTLPAWGPGCSQRAGGEVGWASHSI